MSNNNRVASYKKNKDYRFLDETEVRDVDGNFIFKDRLTTGVPNANQTGAYGAIQ